MRSRSGPRCHQVTSSLVRDGTDEPTPGCTEKHAHGPGGAGDQSQRLPCTLRPASSVRRARRRTWHLGGRAERPRSPLPVLLRRIFPPSRAASRHEAPGDPRRRTAGVRGRVKNRTSRGHPSAKPRECPLGAMSPIRGSASRPCRDRAPEGTEAKPPLSATTRPPPWHLG